MILFFVYGCVSVGIISLDGSSNLEKSVDRWSDEFDWISCFFLFEGWYFYLLFIYLSFCLRYLIFEYVIL